MKRIITWWGSFVERTDKAYPTLAPSCPAGSPCLLPANQQRARAQAHSPEPVEPDKVAAAGTGDTGRPPGSRTRSSFARLKNVEKVCFSLSETAPIRLPNSRPRLRRNRGTPERETRPTAQGRWRACIRRMHPSNQHVGELGKQTAHSSLRPQVRPVPGRVRQSPPTCACTTQVSPWQVRQRPSRPAPLVPHSIATSSNLHVHPPLGRALLHR